MAASLPQRASGSERLLDEALKSPMAELPENQPKGMLGEYGMNLRKAEDYAPDLNAGISQENDTPVVWMAIVLGYLLFFVPGFVILWTAKRIPLRTKIRVSAVFGIGVALVIVAVVTRG